MASEKIDALELDITSKSSTGNIDKLITSLGKLSQALNNLKSKKVSVDIQQTGTSAASAAENADKLANSFFSLGIRITAVISIFKKLGSVISDGVANSATYIKTLNMFNVALGQYSGTASKYSETVSNALGIDPAEWKRTQAVFATMLKGVGIIGDKAAYMSQNLTQLAYDASTYNGITVEEAANKLKSGLAGRTQPVRTLGFAVDQTEVVDYLKNPKNYGKQTFYKDKETGAIKANSTAIADNTAKIVGNYNQLDTATKYTGRYNLLMLQSAHFQGNFAKALNDPYNQMRIFKDQLSMTSRAFGNMFIPALNKVLPYLSAFAQLATEAFQSLAQLFGFELPDMKDRTSIDTKSYDDVVKKTGKAANNAKKMKDYMLGIDELNVFNPNTGAGAGGGAKNGKNSDLSKLKLRGYDFLGKAVENSIKKAKENIQKFFDDLKKNPFLLDDIFKWGAGELGANFWEGLLGKSPEKLAKDADKWGMTIGQAFILSFTDAFGDKSADIIGLLIGKSPEDLGADAYSSGMTVGEYLIDGFTKKCQSLGFTSSASDQTLLDMLFGSPDNLARRAAATGRSVGDQFHKEFARSILTFFNSNPISAWLYNMATGRDIQADLALLESKLSMSAETMGNTFGKGFAKGVDGTKSIIEKSANGSAKTYYSTLGSKSNVSSTKSAGEKLGKAGNNGVLSFNSGKVSFKTTGDEAGAGYVLGVKKHEGASKKVGGIIGLNALNQIRKTLGIKSPSREFAKVGMYSVEGYANAVEQNSYLASNAVSDMASKALGAFGNAAEISNAIITSGSVADPMSSGSYSMPATNAGYGIGAANTDAMASLAGSIYQAVVSGMSSVGTGSNGDIKVIIDGKEVFKAVQTESRKRGVAISNGAFSR